MAAAMNAGMGTVGFMVNPTTVTSSSASSVPARVISSGSIASSVSCVVLVRLFRVALDLFGRLLADDVGWVARPALASTLGVKDRVVISSFIVAHTSAVEFHRSIFDQSQGVPIWRSLICTVSIVMAAAIPPLPMRAQSARSCRRLSHRLRRDESGGKGGLLHACLPSGVRRRGNKGVQNL